tara:strand:- start:4311 stop:5036 length:726 start_codon:yes stop_codon:yes gene_type:complete
MKIEKVKITTVKNNPNNPRVIKNDAFKTLVKSIKDAPWMLQLRSIVVNDENIVLGGNQRLRACQEAGLKEVYIIKASSLTEEQQREFIIKDNMSSGEWDWDALANEFEAEDLNDWGVKVPVLTETEKLSKLEFEDVYYEPKEQPKLNLSHCIDTNLFNKKVEFIEASTLSDELKQTLKMFAYRFIKIDFESVANYYYFNASKEEQKVIERLRLVLCDSGINGFIEDDLLRIHELLQNWNND